MKRIVVAVVACFLIPIAGCDSLESGGETNADRIVGVWTISKVGGKAAQLSTAVEFTKDGKVKMLGTDLGSYKVTGDRVTFVRKDGEGKNETDTSTIRKLDGDGLVLFDEAKQQETEYTRKQQ